MSFLVNQNVCFLLLSVFLTFVFSQGRVLRSDAVKVINSHFIANIPQSVQVKELFLNRSIFGKDINKS